MLRGNLSWLVLPRPTLFCRNNTLPLYYYASTFLQDFLHICDAMFAHATSQVVSANQRGFHSQLELAQVTSFSFEIPEGVKTGVKLKVPRAFCAASVTV